MEADRMPGRAADDRLVMGEFHPGLLYRWTSPPRKVPAYFREAEYSSVPELGVSGLSMVER